MTMHYCLRNKIGKNPIRNCGGSHEIITVFMNRLYVLIFLNVNETATLVMALEFPVIHKVDNIGI